MFVFVVIFASSIAPPWLCNNYCVGLAMYERERERERGWKREWERDTCVIHMRLLHDFVVGRMKIMSRYYSVCTTHFLQVLVDSQVQMMSLHHYDVMDISQLTLTMYEREREGEKERCIHMRLLHDCYGEDVNELILLSTNYTFSTGSSR